MGPSWVPESPGVKLIVSAREDHPPRIRTVTGWVSPPWEVFHSRMASRARAIEAKGPSLSLGSADCPDQRLVKKLRRTSNRGNNSHFGSWSYGDSVDVSFGHSGLKPSNSNTGDLFQDFGIDPLGFLRQQATLFWGKTNRLSAVEFRQLFFQTATFFMKPFDLPLLVAFSPGNQPCLQPFEHDDGSLMQRRGNSIARGRQSFNYHQAAVTSEQWTAVREWLQIED